MLAAKRCPKCLGEMHERMFHSIRDLLLYCLLFAGIGAGVVLIFHVPGIGWIIGPALIVLALWSGLQVRGEWLCDHCGHAEVFLHFGTG